MNIRLEYDGYWTGQLSRIRSGRLTTGRTIAELTIDSFHDRDLRYVAYYFGPVRAEDFDGIKTAENVLFAQRNRITKAGLRLEQQVHIGTYEYSSLRNPFVDLTKNARINVYHRDGQQPSTIKTDTGQIVESRKGEFNDPTLNIFGDSLTISAILNAKYPLLEMQKALFHGKLEYEVTGFWEQRRHKKAVRNMGAADPFEFDLQTGTNYFGKGILWFEREEIPRIRSFQAMEKTMAPCYER